MYIPRILRTVIGLVAVLLVAGLFYLLWRLYSYFYSKKIEHQEPEPEPELPREEEKYHPPTFVYDEKEHEFYVKNEAEE